MSIVWAQCCKCLHFMPDSFAILVSIKGDADSPPHAMNDDDTVPGILVPDLCLEETEVMHAATKKAGLELTQLVTPTTPQERMKRIAAVSEGFVYLVSVTGQSLSNKKLCVC